MDLNGKHLQTVVIGAGQSGLVVGYFLYKNKQDFLILYHNIPAFASDLPKEIFQVH